MSLIVMSGDQINARVVFLSDNHLSALPCCCILVLRSLILMAGRTAICQFAWLAVIILFDLSFVAFLSFATLGIALQLGHA